MPSSQGKLPNVGRSTNVVSGVPSTQGPSNAETGDPGRLNRAISHPGSVKINVQGAFIVEDDPHLTNGSSEGVHYERKDIRLPHHTGVVSHVAVDVIRLREVVYLHGY